MKHGRLILKPTVYMYLYSYSPKCLLSCSFAQANFLAICSVQCVCDKLHGASNIGRQWATKVVETLFGNEAILFASSVDSLIPLVPQVNVVARHCSLCSLTNRKSKIVWGEGGGECVQDAR